MKIAISAFLGLVFFFSAKGQEAYTQKALWMVGGNGQVYIERLGDQQGRLVAIVEPQVGYFLNNKWAIGARLPMSFKSTEYEIRLVPFVRYYIPVKGNIIPFFEVNTGIGWRSVKALNGSRSLTTSYIIGARGGAAIFLRKNISLDLFLYYTGRNTSTKYDTIETTPSLYQFMGLGVGFQIYLGGGEED